MLENELYAMYGNAGLIHFVLIYFAGGFAATIWPFIRNHDNDLYFSVGASGAVSAIIFAAIIWNPTMEMMLIFLPIPIKAYIFGPLLLLFEYFSMKYSKSNIAHDAHIGGAIFGIIYILIINIDKGKEFLTTIFQ
jgi:membrane associated rhomboid family serine protease